MIELKDIINKCLKLDENLIDKECLKNIKNIKISLANSLEYATNNDISFFNEVKQLDNLKQTKAKVVFIKQEFIKYLPKNTIALISKQPYVCLAIASSFFKYKHKVISNNNYKIAQNSQIAQNVFISDGVKIGKNVVIYAGAFIGENVVLGDNCVIYANVSIYHNCIIGNNVIIHSGSTIGSDGFGFANFNGEHIKIYQNGNVKIENNVEIGANCAIDRAVFGSTILENMVKLDNLVHIAHNCIIKKGTFLAGQVGMAGGVSIGEYCSFGGQSALNSNVVVAPFSIVAGKSGVVSDITQSHKVWAGFPCEHHITWKKKQIKLSQLITKNSNKKKSK
jgi:UDP-3-O-[3-hydroxymyristoyl] glucosamine N-acyltransferase